MAQPECKVSTAWGPSTHRFKLPQEGMLQRPLPWWLRHVQVQLAAPAHSVQAQDEGHVVLKQAGVCGPWRAQGRQEQEAPPPPAPAHNALTCVVQVVLQPALGALVVKLAPS